MGGENNSYGKNDALKTGMARDVGQNNNRYKTEKYLYSRSAHSRQQNGIIGKAATNVA